MKVIQEDNFFPRLDFILPEIKKIKLYTKEEMMALTNIPGESWPGTRSKPLTAENIFLHEYMCHLIFQKKLIEGGLWEIKSHLHLRLEKDDSSDWIHKDLADLSVLIYLSKTNLNSGTYLYDENNNIVNDIKFVQNRIVVFPGEFNHKGYGHHGKDIYDGRLTFNLFLTKGK